MSEFGEYNAWGETSGGVTTETVERELTFFHVIHVDFGPDVAFKRDVEKDRTEIRLSGAGLQLLESLCREARAEQARRIRAAEGR